MQTLETLLAYKRKLWASILFDKKKDAPQTTGENRRSGHDTQGHGRLERHACLQELQARCPGRLPFGRSDQGALLQKMRSPKLK